MSGQNESKVVRLKDGRTRQFRSKQERRQIVGETLKPNASVGVGSSRTWCEREPGVQVAEAV